MRGLAAANPADSEAALDVVRFLYTIKKAPAAAREELNARINAGGEIFPYQMALAEMDFAEGNLTDGKQLLEKLISAGQFTGTRTDGKDCAGSNVSEQEKFRFSRDVGDRGSPRRSSQRLRP